MAKLARSRIIALGILLLMLVPALTACGSGTTSGSGTTAKKFKIGLVTDTGGLNDKGFNALAYTGEQNAVKQLGVVGDVKESKSDTDYVPNMTGFASQGYDLVICVGFLMETALGQVAQQFPNTHFAIIDGVATDAKGNTLNLPNVLGLSFKEQDAGALVGTIAGMLEKDGLSPKKSGIISAVGGVSIPPVNHYIAGYKWAATREDSSVQVKVDYSNDFNDSSKCRDVAKAQIAAGSDIVFQVAGGCGLGALTAAGQAGVYSIGVDTDQKTDDNSVIASAMKRVDTATFDAIQEVVQGKFQSGTMTFGLNNDGVGYAPGNISLPQDIQTEVTSVEAQIKAGTLTPPDTIPA